MTKSQAFWPLVVVCSMSIVANIVLLRAAHTGDEDYVAYRPVYFDTRAADRLSAFRINRGASSDAHLEKVRLVLDHYKLDYRDDDGVLMIRRELWEDKDRMSEITSKARDWDWLTNVGGYEVDKRDTVVREGPTFGEMRERLEQRVNREP